MGKMTPKHNLECKFVHQNQNLCIIDPLIPHNATPVYNTILFMCRILKPPIPMSVGRGVWAGGCVELRLGCFCIFGSNVYIFLYYFFAQYVVSILISRCLDPQNNTVI